MRLTSPEKLLWPAAGVTKAALREYVESVADRMLPPLAGRPLTLLRHPSGVDAKGFLQKDLPGSAPAWLPRHEQYSPSSSRTVHYPLAGVVDDLRWMANQNTVEWHAMLVRADRDDRPDVMAFDLDPAPDSGPPVVWAAHRLREVLDALGLEALVKTSGKRGLHLLVPIARRYDHSEVRALGLAIARVCADHHPAELTVAMRKADRGDRLLLDWSRNGGAQTLVAAYSPRVTPTATVATPLSWDEVTDDLDPAEFTVATVPGRGDPWTTAPAPQRLDRVRSALERNGYEVRDASPRSRIQ